MDEMNSVAPAHNPPYMAAMKQLASMSKIPLVAAFETDFHQTIPEAWKRYAIPSDLAAALPIRKWGFHGASHRFISGRAAELLGRTDARIVSCHLGGSSSLCAIQGGKSVATTMGMSPQSGLPQNNRVGDLDPFALPLMMQHTGLSLDQLLHKLATQAGLLGLSGGLSGDVRDLEQAADSGNAEARLALDVYIADIRRQLGGMMMAMSGVDAIVFTGGIGETENGFARASAQGWMILEFVSAMRRINRVHRRDGSMTEPARFSCGSSQPTKKLSSLDKRSRQFKSNLHQHKLRDNHVRR